MTITRHYLEVGGRRMHYRKAGKGPPLLMAHQSPRSSAEYIPLMARWARHFTCIAPDTPGFGQSGPLANPKPEIGDYADALVEFVEALGIERTHAYGFHSGGIILVTALKRHPGKFHSLAVGGYAVWTPEEMALFGERYIPPFVPSAYGEHLTWLWNRVLEQSWFFPWFDARPEARLSIANDDPLRVDAIVREVLDAGDAYRLGYGAVLRSPRDTPPPDADVPPVLIAAYDGDPLQTHIDRLGALPKGWSARKVGSPDALEAAALAHLQATPAPDCRALPESEDSGFVRVASEGFDGLIHWRGRRGEQLIVHAPGRAAELVDVPGALAIDLPGHGLSDNWRGAAPDNWNGWHAVIEAAAAALDAGMVAHEIDTGGDPARRFPDLAPDRFGAYLTRAWSIVRARALFDPWYEASAGTARKFDPAALDPARLAIEHRALLNARSARAYATARQTGR